MRFDLTLKIFPNVFLQGHSFRVAQFRVGFRTAIFIQTDLRSFITFGKSGEDCFSNRGIQLNFCFFAALRKRLFKGTGKTMFKVIYAAECHARNRKALGAWLERVVFSSPQGDGPAGAPLPAPLPFGTHDFRTRQVRLTPANFMDTLQASCSIPFVLQAVHHIEGAPPGAYWDGGLTDYHMHLAYHQPQGAINNIAASAYSESAAGRFDSQFTMGGSEALQGAGLVLYPHFQHQVVPGWLDKALRWRHKATPALDSMVVLSPDPQWVKTLPNAKLPDRQDFTHYGPDTAARSKAWLAATGAAQQLADELAQWLQRPDMGVVHRL